MQDAASRRFQGGAGQRIYKLRSAAAGTIYYRHRYYVDDRAPGFDRGDPSTWKIAVPLIAEPETQNTSVYVQDSWRVMPNFTINAGVRWERQNVRRPRGRRADRSRRQLRAAPRRHLGRRQQRPQQAVRELRPLLREHPDGHQHPRVRRRARLLLLQLQPEPGQHRRRTRRAPSRAARCSAARTPVDPNLKGQYIDEYLGGFEYEIAPQPRRRHQGHLPQARPRDRGLPRCRSSGDVLHRQPGRGHSARSWRSTTSRHARRRRRRSAPTRAFELTARKRFSNN